MKYIFLDFDGVINNWYKFNGVASENVAVLKKIIDILQAKIIVTSSNKYEIQRFNNVDYFKSNLYIEYIKPLNDLGVEIYDMTPIIYENKTLEIKNYIEEHGVEQYVILDDELVGEELQDHQVFLDLYRGLQEEHIIPAINILSGKLGFYPSNYDRTESSENLLIRINEHYNRK